MGKVFLDIYNLTSDTNFAPHHNSKIMSLACCMVKIRKRVGKLWFDRRNQEKGLEYWVVGRVGSGLDSEKKNWLIYFMMVEDVMSFDRYYREFGDKNRDDTLYKFLGNCGCSEDDCGHKLDYTCYEEVRKPPLGHSKKHDIGKGQYVLISSDYCYYGWRNGKRDLLSMDGWGIPELQWMPEGNKGPFYRKYNFKEPETIIEKLKELKERNCERYLPNSEDTNGCHPRKEKPKRVICKK